MKTYTVNTHINTVEEIEDFFHHIVCTLKVNFHPDDRFEDYIKMDTHEPSFSTEECALYNRLMEEAFDVCEREGKDIYEIGMNELSPSYSNN